MVIDMLNMSQHTKLQRESFGGQPSEEIDDYRGLDQWIDTPRGAMLRKIVDPWEYRQRLTQPKLVILGTNDRYWPLEGHGRRRAPMAGAAQAHRVGSAIALIEIHDLHLAVMRGDVRSQCVEGLLDSINGVHGLRHVNPY